MDGIIAKNIEMVESIISDPDATGMINPVDWEPIYFGKGDAEAEMDMKPYIRVSPKTGKKINVETGMEYINNGSDQVYSILICCELYAEVHGIKVRVPNIYIEKDGASRHCGEESFALAELFTDMLQQEDDNEYKNITTYVVAIDSLRIGYNEFLINTIEEILQDVNPNNKLMFLETWGLNNKKVAAARYNHRMRKALISANISHVCAGKSLPTSKDGLSSQEVVNSRKNEILNDKDDKAHVLINKAKEYGVQYLGASKSVIDVCVSKWKELALKVNNGDITAKDAMVEWKEYVDTANDNDISPKDAAFEFLTGVDKNVVDNNRVIVIDYGRGSTNCQSGDDQMAANTAAGEVIYNDEEQLKMILYDLGKSGWHIGHNGFVAAMILICVNNVQRITMGEPARGARIFCQVEMMLALCGLTNTEPCFSRTLGKDGMDMAVKESEREEEMKSALEAFKKAIKGIETEDLMEGFEHDIYIAMKEIYNCQINK